MKVQTLKRLFSAILVIVMIATLTNCAKVKQTQLIGDWQLVWPGEDIFNVVWTFYDDGSVVRVSNDSIVDLGHYTFKTKMVVPYIIFSDFEVLPNLAAKNGTYKLVKINKEHLVLQRIQINEDEPPFHRSEFVRL